MNRRPSLYQERRHLETGEVIEDSLQIHPSVVAGSQLHQLHPGFAQTPAILRRSLYGVKNMGRLGPALDNDGVSRSPEL